LGAKYFAEMIIVNNSLLELALDFNEINDQGGRFLADGISQNNCLQKISLSYVI